MVRARTRRQRSAAPSGVRIGSGREPTFPRRAAWEARNRKMNSGKRSHARRSSGVWRQRAAKRRQERSRRNAEVANGRGSVDASPNPSAGDICESIATMWAEWTAQEPVLRLTPSNLSREMTPQLVPNSLASDNSTSTTPLIHPEPVHSDVKSANAA